MKFLVFPCIQQESETYIGSAITLADATNVSFILSFPVSDENAEIINYLLENNSKDISMDNNSLGIYKTMIDTWESGERFLSGIYMDFNYNEEFEEEIISVKLIVSGPDGMVDGITDINFSHAVILATLEGKEIILSDRLVKKLIPDETYFEDDEDDDEDDSPEDDNNGKDQDILNIAKGIISGRIK